MILWSIVYVASCHLEIFGAHNIAIGIAERKTPGGVFHRSCNQCYTFKYYCCGDVTEYVKVLMTYYNGPSYVTMAISEL